MLILGSVPLTLNHVGGIRPIRAPCWRQTSSHPAFLNAHLPCLLASSPVSHGLLAPPPSLTVVHDGNGGILRDMSP